MTRVKKYVGYLVSFLFGGVIFGCATFYCYAYFIGKFMSDNLNVAETVSAKQSIRIIENIKRGELDKAIWQLEFNIYNSKIFLGDCENCFDREKDSLKIISEYEITEFTP